MKGIKPKTSHRIIINLLWGFYCPLMILTLSLCFSISTAWSKPNIISWGKGITINGLLIKFKSVKISPVYETGRLSMFLNPIIEKPKENYKFVIITVEGENIGKRRSTLGDLGSTQYFEIEVDKGYFYSTILGASHLVFDLLPEETKEGRLVFEIPQDTKPTKLHCNIKGREFVVVLDESKFIYPEGAKVSIEDYKISYNSGLDYCKKVRKEIWQQWVYPDTGQKDLETIISIRIMKDGTISMQKIEKSSGNPLFDKSSIRALTKANPLSPPPYEMEISIRFSPSLSEKEISDDITLRYMISHIAPVIRNSGDLPITVNFEIELNGFKEVGRRGPYVLPSNSILTLQAFSPVPPWHWQNLKMGDYPIVSGGEHSLKVIVKDETGKVVADKIFSVLIK